MIRVLLVPVGAVRVSREEVTVTPLGFLRIDPKEGRHDVDRRTAMRHDPEDDDDAPDSDDLHECDDEACDDCGAYTCCGEAHDENCCANGDPSADDEPGADEPPF
jgi:hypothetical protein